MSFSESISGFTGDDDSTKSDSSSEENASAQQGGGTATATEDLRSENSDSLEELENLVPMNSGYVKPSEREEADEETYDLEREGNYDGNPKTVDREFTIAAWMDPNRQRDPNGVYLDDVRRRQAEVLRARVENREPNFDEAATTVGDLVISKENAVSRNAVERMDVPKTMTLPVVVGNYKEADDGSLSQENQREVEDVQIAEQERDAISSRRSSQ